MKDKLKESCEKFELIENATVIYRNDYREQLKLIRVVDEGVIIGRIIDGDFLDCGFISKDNIKEIRYSEKSKLKI